MENLYFLFKKVRDGAAQVFAPIVYWFALGFVYQVTENSEFVTDDLLVVLLALMSAFLAIMIGVDAHFLQEKKVTRIVKMVWHWSWAALFLWYCVRVAERQIVVSYTDSASVFREYWIAVATVVLLVPSVTLAAVIKQIQLDSAAGATELI